MTGQETEYIRQAVEGGKISGNGEFTHRCQEFFEKRYGFRKCLLTTSCTDALEMAAILTGVGPGDEVIVPSYTFVSTALAFLRCGAKVVFADSRDEKYQLNMNQDRIIRSLAQFADMCKQYGCHASLELNHGGENEAFEDIGHAPFGASPRISGNESWRSIVYHRDPIACQEMSVEKIKDTIGKYPYHISTDCWIYTIKLAIDQTTGRDLTDQYGTQDEATQKHK